MSNYTQTTYFGPKDSLPPGDPAKRVLGTEVDAELGSIADAIVSKYDGDNLPRQPGSVGIGYNGAPVLTSGNLESGKMYVMPPESSTLTLLAQNMTPGAVYGVLRSSTGAVTLSASSGITLRLAGTPVTGSRTIAPYGYAIIWVYSSTVAYVTGSGVT